MVCALLARCKALDAHIKVCALHGSTADPQNIRDIRQAQIAMVLHPAIGFGSRNSQVTGQRRRRRGRSRTLRLALVRYRHFGVTKKRERVTRVRGGLDWLAPSVC